MGKVKHTKKELKVLVELYANKIVKLQDELLIAKERVLYLENVIEDTEYGR